jgi:hypothetical protein
LKSPFQHGCIAETLVPIKNFLSTIDDMAL